MTFKTQPDGIVKDELSHVREVVNRNTTRIFTAHQTLDGTAIKAPALGSGFAVQSGSLKVTGSQLGIKTGLTAVQQVVAGIDNGATATNFWVTSRVTPANKTTIDVFVWQPTAAGNNTPIAATTPVVIRWWVTGTSTASQ